MFGHPLARGESTGSLQSEFIWWLSLLPRLVLTIRLGLVGVPCLHLPRVALPDGSLSGWLFRVASTLSLPALRGVGWSSGASLGRRCTHPPVTIASGIHTGFASAGLTHGSSASLGCHHADHGHSLSVVTFLGLQANLRDRSSCGQP